MKTATVTGATGYVGAELIRQLLQKGYRVKGTARCPPDAPQLAHLHSAAKQTKGELHIFQVASLLEASKELDAAVEGSTYIFHVASPFRFDGDPLHDIVQPAVNGTDTVLRTVARHKQPGQRVVVTSSVCAIYDRNTAQPPAAADGLYTEEDWNNVSKVEDEGYWVSKVEAERRAWQLAGELGLDLVTILPNFVLGPVSTPTTSGISVGFMKSFLEAKDGKVPSGTWVVEDVRDVAAAHVLAAETPSASGRYIISLPQQVDARQITDAIKRRIPEAAAALPDGDTAPTKLVMGTDKAQRELGLVYRPFEETIGDMAASLIEHGIAQPAWVAAEPAAAS